MDAYRIYAALAGDLDLFELSVAERLAYAHEVVRAEVRRPAPVVLRASFTVPEEIERLYRGTSS